MMTSGYEFSVQLHCQGFFQLKLVEESNDRFPIAPGVGTVIMYICCMDGA